MQDNNQIIKLFPGEPGVEAFYTEREAVLPPPNGLSDGWTRTL